RDELQRLGAAARRGRGVVRREPHRGAHAPGRADRLLDRWCAVGNGNTRVHCARSPGPTRRDPGGGLESRSNPMPNTPQVDVAGAGPVGLLTALALAERGVPVLVLETEPALTIDLRAGTFHPPSLELMAPYGITDEMHKTAIKVPRWQIRDRRQGVIVEWDLSEIGD